MNKLTKLEQAMVITEVIEKFRIKNHNKFSSPELFWKALEDRVVEEIYTDKNKFNKVNEYYKACSQFDLTAEEVFMACEIYAKIKMADKDKTKSYEEKNIMLFGTSKFPDLNSDNSGFYKRLLGQDTEFETFKKKLEVFTKIKAKGNTYLIGKIIEDKVECIDLTANQSIVLNISIEYLFSLYKTNSLEIL